MAEGLIRNLRIKCSYARVATPLSHDTNGLWSVTAQEGRTGSQSSARRPISAVQMAAARPCRLRGADAGQLPHEQPEIEAAHVHEHTLQDVGMVPQMHAAQPPGLVEVRVGPFEQLAALPQ